MTRSSLIASLLLAAGVAGLTATPATAAPGAVPARVVRFDDLNLEQARGVQILYRRIQVAAGAVCGEPVLPGTRFVSPLWKACVADAVQRAVAQVDRPALTAYHEARATAPSLIRTAAVTRRNQGS